MLLARRTSLLLLTMLTVVFLITGCISAAQPQESLPGPAPKVEGAIITANDAAGLVLRAYGPSVTVVFDTKAKTSPMKTTVTVTNIATQALTTKGIAPTIVQILSPTSAKYEIVLPPNETPSINFTAATASSFSVAIIGDNRDGRPTYQRLLAVLNSVNPAFVINGGDLVPSGRESEYTEFLADSAVLRMPYYTLLGNHDIPNGGRAYYNRNLAPNYYDFVWGNARFILTDNAEGGMDEAQLAWLEKLLTNRTTKHVFLIMHKPPFDPRPSRSHTMDSAAQADKIMTWAAQYRVTAAFASHIHMFWQGEKQGVPWYITGGAGAPLAAKKEAGGFNHYVLVKIDGDNVTVSPVAVDR